MTPPRTDHQPHNDGESEPQRSHPPVPYTSRPWTTVPRDLSSRPGESGWDWPLIVIEGLTVVVCAPLAVVLIATDAAERMAGWWWLVVAGMLAAWAGESVGKLAHHASAVRAVHKRRQSQPAHADPRTNESVEHRTPGDREIPGGHTGPSPRGSDGNPKPGDRW